MLTLHHIKIYPIYYKTFKVLHKHQNFQYRNLSSINTHFHQPKLYENFLKAYLHKLDSDLDEIYEIRVKTKYSSKG